MKIKLLVAAAATVLAGSAMAQSAFQGFYGQLGTGYESNSIGSTSMVVGPSPEGIHTGGSSASTSISSSNAALVVGLGYNFSVSPKFVLGLGADYSALPQTTGVATYNFGGGCSDANGGCANIKYQISNRYSIFATPGYAIDKDKLAYLKVGYSGETLATKPQGAGAPSNASNTLSGYVLGLGYKQIISGGFYGFGEANYYGYSKPTITGTATNTDGSGPQKITLNPSVSAYQLLVGVGYKF